MPFPALAAAIPIDDVLRQAESHARKGEWLEACRSYEELFRRDRSRIEFRAAYQRCLRQFHLARRHRDPSYRALAQKLTAPQALDLYEQVLSKVGAAYVDQPRAELNQLFQHGLDELTLAIGDPTFVREHLAGVPASALAAFRGKLDEWNQRKISVKSEAREQVRSIARTGQQLGLGTRLTQLFALEFACGACNALDEYSVLLTPNLLGDAQANLRGRFVGVGIDLAVVDNQLEVARVYARSPAAEAGLLRRDRILRIDRASIDQLTPEMVADRLRGDAGSTVELEVASPGQMMPRAVRMVRRSVAAPSVDYEILDDGEAGLYGLVRILAFQDSTVQEVKEALAQVQTLGVRAVLLDLRGNGGGVFRSAVHVAELFLGEGMIAHAEGPAREYQRPFRAEIGNPCTLPLVVLVDGDTASAAELVAGALKENERALVVGQPTFGKGTVQTVLQLDRFPVGLRVTVARFFSPLRNPYAGRGVTPDVPAAQEGDATLLAARQEARRLLTMMMPDR